MAGLCGPSQCSTVAQPFPQRHVCHSLTRELGRAQISTAQPFLGEAEPGPDECRLPLGRLSEADHPCLHGLLRCSCLGSFLPLLSRGLAICHLLPWPPRTGRAIDQVTPPAQAAPPAATGQLVPSFSNGACGCRRLLPGGPPLRAFSLLGGRRALALPGRSDPLSHLLFSLETKISWARPKLSQVCLLF